jgi:myosin-7
MANKKVVRVHFMDDSIRGFAIDENTTAAELKAIIVERVELKFPDCFALFERKDGWERCLENDEKPCELMALWVNNSTGTSNPAFIFKKKIFLRDDSKEMEDTVYKHFIYIQALHSVIESEYPCSIDDALKLAGLQVQIVYGDHKASSHTVGFLTQNLKQFVPKDLFPLKKPNEWEAAIFKAHAMNIGKTAEEAKTEYLEIVKQWPFYGTTFFPPCKTISAKKLPQRVIIGVNAEGILLLKKDKELVSTHPFTEICSWASSSATFAFEFGSQSESQKYTFETRQGAIVASTIQTYIDILVQMLKTPDEEGNEN